MAQNVTVVIMGKEPKVLAEAPETIAELKAQLGSDYAKFVVEVNGNPASDDDSIEDFSFISLAQPIKAGR